LAKSETLHLGQNARFADAQSYLVGANIGRLGQHLRRGQMLKTVIFGVVK